tara:strand:+ start:153 stop:530 length:378 start_codon:yes stop_codon:yes gene_type:complete
LEVALNCTLSVGEVFDKISILEIKKEKISDSVKINSVCRECDLLYEKIEIFPEVERRDFLVSLKKVNLKLWNVEEELRELESLGQFGERFIDLARSVYKLNDQRFSLKDNVNNHFGSFIREVKSY